MNYWALSAIVKKQDYQIPLLPLLIEMSKTSIDIKAWINNDMCIKHWYVISHPYNNFSGMYCSWDMDE